MTLVEWSEEGGFATKADREKLIKDSELRESLEGVFDSITLRYTYELIRRGVIKRFITNISQGKEARVYVAEGADGYVAVKIYFTSASEYYKTMPIYIEGDPRFSHLKRGDRREIVETWARKEYANLSEAYSAGVHVPKPISIRGNVLVMQLVGGSEPAPLLKDVDLTPLSWKRAYNQIMNDLERLVVNAGLVHGDLSEYNVLYYRRPYLIDMGQSVMTSHPRAQEFLFRDVKNLNLFFRKKGIELKDLVKDDLITKWLASRR
ncbi:MAG TPA: serine protein kinase RIO [Thermoprotei archaeon]|nr:serine protein kinase RIO [TACK group archaeon]HEV51764.1 serine protein kinase RIO [Thermoprotei archaeon]